MIALNLFWHGVVFHSIDHPNILLPLPLRSFCSLIVVVDPFCVVDVVAFTWHLFHLLISLRLQPVPVLPGPHCSGIVICCCYDICLLLLLIPALRIHCLFNVPFLQIWHCSIPLGSILFWHYCCSTGAPQLLLLVTRCPVTYWVLLLMVITIDVLLLLSTVIHCYICCYGTVDIWLFRPHLHLPAPCCAVRWYNWWVLLTGADIVLVLLFVVLR